MVLIAESLALARTSHHHQTSHPQQALPFRTIIPDRDQPAVWTAGSQVLKNLRSPTNNCCHSGPYIKMVSRLNWVALYAQGPAQRHCRDTVAHGCALPHVSLRIHPA